MHRKAFSHALVDNIIKAGKSVQGTTISGGHLQKDLMSKKQNGQRHLSDELLEEMLSSLEKLPGVKTGFVIHHAKQLTVSPGGREQVLHADSYLDFDAFICHLNDRPMPATEVLLEPYTPPAMVRPGSPEPSTWPVPWPLEKKNLLQATANKGDVLWFRSSQRHRGPANSSKFQRHVLFVVLGPPFTTESERFDDGSSVYEFEHAKNVHGKRSDQFIAALHRYDDPITATNGVPYDPIMHYWDDKDHTEYDELRKIVGPKNKIGPNACALDMLALAAASSDRDENQ